jgi:hypothetical protein
VLCVRGVFDNSRRSPSLKLQSLLDPETLKKSSWRELHIQLGKGKIEEHGLLALRDAVYSLHGQCKIIFHVPLSTGSEVSIEASPHTTCSASDNEISALKQLSVVEEVWRA